MHLELINLYLAANVTDVRLVSGMNPDVDFKVEVPLERFAADWAAMYPVRRVTS